MSLKAIKNKIRSVSKTHKVTKAMEAVSAVKMRKSQERALEARPYASSALTILRKVAGGVDALNHALTKKREGGITLILIVTSDKGLAGSLNSAVIRRANRYLTESNEGKENVTFMFIGSKGYEYYSKRSYKTLKHFENIGDEVSSRDMREITNEMVSLFEREEINGVFVTYTNFKSTFEQTVLMRQILPINMKEIEEIIDGIYPEKGKGALGEGEQSVKSSVYEIEPDGNEILNELLPFLLNIELYHVLLEAKASEHSARMVAMKNASDKAEEMGDELNLKFNKARQTLITREVSEIIGGMETV